jgi:hypothetical protein
MRDRRNLIATILVALLCCGGCSTLEQQTIPAASGSVRQTTQRAGTDGVFLYVAGLKLSKYALGSSRPLATVKLPYIASTITLDGLGNVYTAENYGSFGVQIDVFSASNLTLLRKISYSGWVTDMATDRDGYLYVSLSGELWVFAPGSTHPLYRMRRSPGGSLAFDSAGNLYDAGGDEVAIYAPASKPGHLKLIGKIRRGVNSSDAIAFGPSGNLYVVNWPNCNPPCGRPFVSVFAAGGLKPVLRITRGLVGSASLAVDSTGRVYVGNSSLFVDRGPRGSWVSVYEPNSKQLLAKFAKGGDRRLLHVAVDGSDDVYVASYNEVSVYSPAGAKLLYTITRGIQDAGALAIGSP